MDALITRLHPKESRPVATYRLAITCNSHRYHHLAPAMTSAMCDGDEAVTISRDQIVYLVDKQSDHNNKGIIMSFIVNLARTGLSLVLIVATSAVSADECVPAWALMTKLVLQIKSPSALWPLQTRQKGISHPLGIVIEPGTPAYPHRYTQLQVVQPNQQFNADLGVGWKPAPTMMSCDVARYGPQLDGLGHMGEAGSSTTVTKAKISPLSPA